MEDLRSKISGEEFDYQALIDGLQLYERPRDKITMLLKQGVIIRIKKGIYIFGEKYRRRPFSREVLANMIYGPSYISLDYALYYHSLIPERVDAMTSITCNRGKRFFTPVGLFVYRGVPMKVYPIGIERLEIADRSFLIASPEKALADKIQQDRGAGIRSRSEMKAYLSDNLRIDPERLERLDIAVIKMIASQYRSRKLRLLCEILQNRNRKGHEHE